MKKNGIDGNFLFLYFCESICHREVVVFTIDENIWLITCPMFIVQPLSPIFSSEVMGALNQ